MYNTWGLSLKTPKEHGVFWFQYFTTQISQIMWMCGFGCWRWSKQKRLDKVGWLSVRQLVFYHTVLQAHKTITAGLPKPLHQSFSSCDPYRSISSSTGQIRHDSSLSAKSTFKYRAMQSYNRVPASVRIGSTVTVKRKLKQWIIRNIPIDQG